MQRFKPMVLHGINCSFGALPCADNHNNKCIPNIYISGVDRIFLFGVKERSENVFTQSLFNYRVSKKFNI